MDRIWELCHILDGEERSAFSVGAELGLNYEAAKKTLQRFRCACRVLDIILVTKTDPDNKQDATYMVITPEWRDRCLRFLMMISRNKSMKR